MSNFTAKQLHYEVTSLRLRRNFTRDLRSRWWAQVESSHAPHSRLKRSAVFHARLFCFSPTAAGAALVGSSGVEPPTSRLSGARSNLLSYEPVFPSAVLRDKSSLLSSLALRAFGGDDGIRTHDPLLAGQVLSQLSYTPTSYPIRFCAPQKLNNKDFQDFAPLYSGS